MLKIRLENAKQNSNQNQCIATTDMLSSVRFFAGTVYNFGDWSKQSYAWKMQRLKY